MNEESITSNPELQEESGRNPDGTFKKGFSGNPAGKPRKKTFRDYFTEEEEVKLIEKIKAELEGETRPDIIKMTIEHIFGKPRQNIGLDGGEDGKPLGVVILPQKNANPLGADNKTTGSTG